MANRSRYIRVLKSVLPVMERVSKNVDNVLGKEHRTALNAHTEEFSVVYVTALEERAAVTEQHQTHVQDAMVQDTRIARIVMVVMFFVQGVMAADTRTVLCATEQEKNKKNLLRKLLHLFKGI